MQGRTRRDRLADAAITTLAREGMRGLTHRAVDRTAGLAEGSCSYYFRTRQALLRAAVERLEVVDAADVAELPALVEPFGTLPEVADAAARLAERWLGPGRERMLARYELALEANRRPELKEVFVAAGRRSRAMAERLLVAAGAADPKRQAPILVACLDGMLFDHLAGAGVLRLTRPQLRAAMENLLRSFTGVGAA